MEQLTHILQRTVRDGTVPGVVATLAEASGECYVGAAGQRRRGSAEAMDPDATFRIASMTKLATTIALLQLVERGRVDLAAPVGEYLPAFDELPVLERCTPEEFALRETRTRATIFQLCNHTSGLSYDTWDERLLAYQKLTGLPSISEGKRVAFEAPLVADPGTAFHYGISTDWLGLVIEQASGRPLERYLAEEIFAPLRSQKTTMVLPARQRDELVPVHVRSDDGWKPTTVDLAQNPEFYAGGHGLYSTPREFTRLLRALLCGGALDGERILSARSAAKLLEGSARHPRVPRLRSAIPAASANVDLGPHLRWGCAFPISQMPSRTGRPTGSGGWAGIWNTFYWIDPTAGLVGGYYTQTAPFFDPAVIGGFEEFERAVYRGK